MEKDCKRTEQETAGPLRTHCSVHGGSDGGLNKNGDGVYGEKKVDSEYI